MKSVIAENVREIIKKRGLKQSAVAKMAGFSKQQFSNLLNGRRVITDVDIVKIANVLEIEPGELFAARDEEVGKGA